jgi:formate/nitrite transporter FocA (FNT family)
MLGHGNTQDIISRLLYPLGFVAVIIGRTQLFTENTLFPVVLVLDERRYAWRTLRLWVLVFAGNLIGAFTFAWLCVRTASLTPELRQSLIDIGAEAVRHPSSSHLFWSGVIGGWLIALVAWLVSASQWTSSQIIVTYAITFLMGAGHFAHCIAGSCEILSAVLGNTVTWGEYWRWLAFATTGNVVGGITIVSLLNWGQVAAGDK